MANAYQLNAYQSTGGKNQSQRLNTSSGFFQGGTTTQSQVAQGFVPSVSTITNVQVLLFKTLLPTDNTIVEIQTDGPKPSGTVVGSSPSVPTADLTTDTLGAWVTFAVNATVTAGVKYWIVCRRDIGGAGDTTNYPSWRSTAGNPYTLGGSIFYNGSTSLWGTESASNDEAFTVFGDPATGVFQTEFPARASNRVASQAVKRASVW